MIDKEQENAKLHENFKQWKRAVYKNKKQAQLAFDALPAPDPSIPPFKEVENEPFGGSQGSGDHVQDKLNDFADHTLKMGESIYKRI